MLYICIRVQVGGLVSERLKHPRLWLLRVALWALSTWIGTFFLCGCLSITSDFPFFHSFPELPLQRREEIVIAWSLSWIHVLRVLAKSIKFLTLLVFFTQVRAQPHRLIDFPHQKKKQNPIEKQFAIR